MGHQRKSQQNRQRLHQQNRQRLHQQKRQRLHQRKRQRKSAQRTREKNVFRRMDAAFSVNADHAKILISDSVQRLLVASMVNADHAAVLIPVKNVLNYRAVLSIKKLVLHASLSEEIKSLVRQPNVRLWERSVCPVQVLKTTQVVQRKVKEHASLLMENVLLQPRVARTKARIKERIKEITKVITKEKTKERTKERTKETMERIEEIKEKVIRHRVETNIIYIL